jgi:hypothetical protein
MARTKISKQDLGPLAIDDDDVFEISFAKIASSGATEGQIMQMIDGVWTPVSISGMSTPVDNEVPGGDIDGSNREFTLAYMPSPPASIQLFKGGVLMRQGLANDYVVDNQTIIFNDPPQINDVLLVFYRR